MEEQITEYLLSPDYDIKCIGMELLNRLNLPLGKKYEVLRSADINDWGTGAYRWIEDNLNGGYHISLYRHRLKGKKDRSVEIVLIEPGKKYHHYD